MGEANKDSELDLALSLSLGGCFSKIPKEKPLIRTCSLSGERRSDEREDGGFLSLARSASMPTEVDQELRKVREVQAFKRMEVRRRLSEKHRHVRGGGSDEDKPPPRLPPPAEAKFSDCPFQSASRSNLFCGAVDNLKSNVPPSDKFVIQGHENSKPRVISRVRENGKPINMGNYRSIHPANHCSSCSISIDKVDNGKQAIERLLEAAEAPSKRKKVSANGVGDLRMMEMMRHMPSVTTTGDGPNGKRIEGFLYRYMRGQVSIVCVCHGNFLSPAEFVKHAGGTDMGNPMRRINVLPATI